MSRENVEIVRRIYEAGERRDGETVLSLYDPDIDWDMSRHPYAEMFGGGVASRGRDQLREWFRQWYEAFDNFQHVLEELIDVGDRVVSVGTDRALGRASGIEVERHIAGVWTLRDGLVTRVVWFDSVEDALAAAAED